MIEQFCESILQIEIRNIKALANLVMGLSSSSRARSVVETSMSSVNHYQYSSISKSIKTLYEKEYEELKGSKSKSIRRREEVEKKFVLKEGLFWRKERKVLVAKYRHKPPDKKTFLEFAISPLCLQGE